MDKINSIFTNKKYKEYISILEKIEEERIFCKHDLEHFLSVARIAYIKVLERKLDISKEIIYAIALLHDIGRVLEYNDGIPHHKGSVIIANEILDKSKYDEIEKSIIIKCISSHRKDCNLEEIERIIYESDKLARQCSVCKAEKECYWEKEKKNFIIKY